MTAPPDGIPTTLRSSDWTIHILASGWGALALWLRYWPDAHLSRSQPACLVGPVDLSRLKVGDLRDLRVLDPSAEWAWRGIAPWAVAVPSSVSRHRDEPDRWDAARIVQIVTRVLGATDETATPQGGHSHA